MPKVQNIRNQKKQQTSDIPKKTFAAIALSLPFILKFTISIHGY